MQHTSNNGNRPLALYLGQFVFASNQRKLGTEHDSTRPAKTWKANEVMPVNLFSIYGISERGQNEVRKYNERDTLKPLTSNDLHKP